MMIDVAGNAVDLSGVYHYSARAGFDGRGESRHEILSQVVFWNPGGGAISAVERKTVAHVMLQRCGDMTGGGDVIAFYTAHESQAHYFRQIWIFAKGFIKARPQGLTPNVEHGRKSPWNTGGSRLDGSNLCQSPHQCRIPCGGHSNFLRV